MTPAERQMISDLFTRIGRLGPIEKDREAAQMIGEAVQQIPDAPYFLVQSVLVQDEALRQADARIRELEGRSSGQPSGSFLSGAVWAGDRFRRWALEHRRAPKSQCRHANRPCPPQHPGAFSRRRFPRLPASREACFSPIAYGGSSADIMDQPSWVLPTQTKPLWIVRRMRPRTRAMMPMRHGKTLLRTMLP